MLSVYPDLIKVFFMVTGAMFLLVVFRFSDYRMFSKKSKGEITW